MNQQPGYECTICMESLNNPAPKSPVAGSNEVGPEDSNNSGAGTSVTNDLPSLNDGKLPSKGRKIKAAEKVPDSPEYLSEICGTWCGHLFHKACLDRWFKQTDKKKKNCPTCRKAVALTKIIRMYLPRPSSEEDLPTAENVGNTDLSLQDRSLPSCNCTNEECRQVLSIHEILVKDFNELKTKYVDLVDDNEMLKGEKASLEDEVTRLKNENPASAANHGSVVTPGTSKRCSTNSAVPTASPPKNAKKCTAL